MVQKARLEVSHLESLLEFLDREFEPAKEKIHTFLTEKKVTFDILWLIFRSGSDVIYKDPLSDVKCAGKVHACSSHGF